MKPDKPTKKSTTYNDVVLNSLINKYGLSKDYIRKCLRGDRTGIMPDTITKEYNTLDKEINKTVQAHLNPNKV